MSKTYSAGIVTAYGAAKRAGYQGTYEDFCRQQAGYAGNAAAVEQAKTDAVNAKNDAVTAKNSAVSAKDDAVSAKNTAVSAKDDAVSAKDTATTKAQEASQSATNAGLSAQSAGQSATSADQSARSAEQSAQDISASVRQIATNTADIGLLQADLANIYEITEIDTSILSGTKTTGKSINYTGNVADANTNYYVVSYAITAGEKYIVNGTASKNGYLYIFRDANETVLSTSEQNTSGAMKSYSDILVTAPTSATELIIACHISATYTQASAYIAIYNPKGVPQLQKKFDGIDVKPSITTFIAYTDISGKSINYTGYPVDANASYHVAELAVNAGEKYLMLGACNNGAGNYKYAFYDSNNNLISGLQGSGTGIGIFEASVTVPPNATIMRLNWHASYNPAGAVVEKILASCADSYGWSNLTWVCLGDSITANNVASDKHYFDYIHDRTGIHTVNMGIGGTGYWRGYDNNAAFYQRAANIPACDVITIFGSNNDTVSGYVLGDVTDTTTDTVAGCINTTLDVIFENHPVTPVGIIAPIPVGSKITTNRGNSLEVYSELLGEIASYRGVPFLDLYHESNLRPQDEVQRSLLYSSEVIDGYVDATHPNNAGQKYIYPHFLEFLKTLI